MRKEADAKGELESGSMEHEMCCFVGVKWESEQASRVGVCVCARKRERGMGSIQFHFIDLISVQDHWKRPGSKAFRYTHK